MNTIFQQLVYAREKDKDTVLATIIWDDGSAPRGRGSQMLVDGSGLLAGTIGGGAVEGRSIEIARGMLQSGRKGYTHFFRLQKDGEVGMVCGGDVTVYFCRIPADDAAWGAVAAEVLQRVKDRVPGYLTLPLDGSTAAVTDTDESDGRTRFSVALPDDRPELATGESFPQADEVICGDFAHIEDYVSIRPEDYVVIMTNGHEHDFQAEVQVLRHTTAYVGVIGSRKKTAFVNQRLREAGIGEETIASLHTPIGTAIKAVTPEEIAVSITGEMILVRATAREAGGEVHHGCPMH